MAEELPVIDMEAVMELLGGDEEFLMELLTDFLEDEKKSIEALRDAAAADNHKVSPCPHARPPAPPAFARAPRSPLLHITTLRRSFLTPRTSSRAPP